VLGRHGAVSWPAAAARRASTLDQAAPPLRSAVAAARPLAATTPCTARVAMRRRVAGCGVKRRYLPALDAQLAIQHMLISDMAAPQSLCEVLHSQGMNFRLICFCRDRNVQRDESRIKDHDQDQKRLLALRQGAGRQAAEPKVLLTGLLRRLRPGDRARGAAGLDARASAQSEGARAGRVNEPGALIGACPRPS
jgi:hypothetical protein